MIVIEFRQYVRFMLEPLLIHRLLIRVGRCIEQFGKRAEAATQVKIFSQVDALHAASAQDSLNSISPSNGIGPIVPLRLRRSTIAMRGLRGLPVRQGHGRFYVARLESLLRPSS